MIKCCYKIKADWLYNPDLKEPLQELSQQLELKELYKLYDLMLISRQRLNTQINKHTMFEEILIKWLELNLSK
jgi:DNA polymerase-3 subunit delta'